MSILVLGAGILASTPALAATSETATGEHLGRGQMQERKNGIGGTITAISGTALTVNAHQGQGNTTVIATYTVDASVAKVFKDNVASSLSALAVGDNIKIQGAVSGTNVKATSIRLNQPGGQQGKCTKGQGERCGSSMSAVAGNGQPVVAGNVTAVSGATLNVTTKSGIQYTVDTASAKIVKGPTTITIAEVAVGDVVVVQGLTNGTAISASSVIDQTQSTATNTTGATKTQAGHGGFFGQFGNFFKNLFGF